jgi:hypothetical protein
MEVKRIDEDGYHIPAHMRKVFEVPEARWEIAKSKLEKIQKRATKCGCPPITWEVVEEEDRPIEKTNSLGETEIVGYNRWLFIALEGETPKLNGWVFAAKLTHTEAGNIIAMTPGLELEAPVKYRKTGPACDHCGHDRRRNDTYLVFNEETQEWKQVGSTCIKDFTGVDPRVVLAMYEYFIDCIGCLDDDWDYEGGGGYAELRYEPLKVLVAATTLIRRDGWAPSSYQESSTKAGVQDMLAPAKGKAWARQVDFWQTEVSDGDRAKADETHEWVLTSEEREDELSQYHHNLLIACSGTVGYKEMGLVCSAVVAFNRFKEIETERKKFQSINDDARKAGYFGELKKRVNLEVTVVGLRSWESEWGTTHFYRMVDDEGHLFVWFGSKSLSDEDRREIDPGDRIRIRTTIKKHDMYKEVPQTVVTRTQLTEVVDRVDLSEEES